MWWTRPGSLSQRREPPVALTYLPPDRTQPHPANDPSTSEGARHDRHSPVNTDSATARAAYLTRLPDRVPKGRCLVTTTCDQPVALALAVSAHGSKSQAPSL